MTVERRPVTAEDRRRSVEAAVRRRQRSGRAIRITEGMRRWILHSSEYRAGRRVEDDAGEWGWP